MSTNIMESKCERCAHFPVCAFKERFENVKETIQSTEISENQGDKIGLFRIFNMDWVNVSVVCNYYMRKEDMIR